MSGGNINSLLDFNTDFNVPLLDETVQMFYNPSHPGHNDAKNVLTQLQANPNSWTRVSLILEKSQRQETKFIALQILGDTILYRWNAIAPDARSGIKDYIVQTIISLSKAACQSEITTDVDLELALAKDPATLNHTRKTW